MDISNKKSIVAAVLGYMQEHTLSQNEMCRRTKINAAYMSAILNGDESIGETVIKDSFYERLASEVGFSLEVDMWPHIKTMQFAQIIKALTDAKNGQSSSALRTITAPAGFGKTDGIDRFCEKNPKHTYRITVSDAMLMSDVVNELLRLLGLPVSGTKHAKYVAIALKLRDIRQQGGKPLVIFDEAENAKRPLLRMLKSLYDGVNQHCVIALIGTDQLLDRMLRDKAKNVTGIPQVYSRMKSGIIELSETIEFAPFYDALNIDKELRKLLNTLCSSYRELRDYLLPAMQEMKKLGEPLTVSTFKRFHAMR